MQDKFIDSLINNYVLQPLILIEIRDENKNESTNYQSTLKPEEKGFEFECIDGRHRLKIIKAFIEGETVNENKEHKIRYIKHEIETNKRSKKYNTIIKKNIYYTNLCDKDKQKFNTSSIPITKITIRINTKEMPRITLLLKSILKDMFLRLQTGVKVSTIDKFRNLEEPVVEALHNNKLLMLKTYKINQHISEPTDTSISEINDIWSLIPEIINIPTPTKTGMNTSSLTFITLFNITCLLIIQKKSLNIGSYMQLNIFKSIQNKYTVFGTTECSEWNKHIKTLYEFFTRLNKFKYKSKSSKYYDKLKKIDKNIIYMLLYQYIKTGDTKGGTFAKYIVYIENIRKVFYNITGTKKSIFDKPQQIVIDGSDFDLFINIISDNLLCGTLNCDVNSLRKQCIDKLSISKSNKLSTKPPPPIPPISPLPLLPSLPNLQSLPNLPSLPHLPSLEQLTPEQPYIYNPCRKLKDCIKNGTLIKHIIKDKGEWIGIYDSKLNIIKYGSIEFSGISPLNKFANAHYRSYNKDNTCNAWETCYCEINTMWVSMGNLPVIELTT